MLRVPIMPKKISAFTEEQKALVRGWNKQNPHRTYKLKYCHADVAELNETVFKKQPLPTPTHQQLAQAKRDRMAQRRSMGATKRLYDNDFSINVSFKPVIDAVSEEVKKQLQEVLPEVLTEVLPDIIKPLLVSGTA